MWQDVFKLEFFVKNIDGSFCVIKDDKINWYITFIQGPPYYSKKPKFWDDLKNLGNRFIGPWMIMGDFNEIFGKDEK